ncbi:MAG: sulfatase-like hydrolase/transferase, partial [Oscillospiraceae bacterium]|nr:sulfatase-like hydrolase/transferase [Oscillospiraceae bacterium]
MATKGINFTDYYQPASAGATGGEYQNIFGLLPSEGGKSFKKTVNYNNYFTMGKQLNRLGYFGQAFHNNSYTFYDRNKTHVNLGYSAGFMGYGNGMEEYVKNCWPQSDLEMMQGTFPLYSDKEHFNIYYMSVSGHNNYNLSGNSMTKKNWEYINSFDKLSGYSDTVKGYFAANVELDKAMEYLIGALEEKGLANDTVICISADHFPYGLDANGKLGNMPYLSELYGYNVTTIMNRDHNRLILWSGCLEDKEPIIVSSPTFSLDIVPTLSNLFGTEFDSRFFPGRDVFSDAEALVFNSGYDWKTDLGTYTSSTGK